ncbi:unnamed protein product [Pieris macdunnoughi]|uniref:Strictosidine synthase conserved region domain-containing protein n=1 Tax=Pieris macdunnoughi TaxID=345717 RepID=A0A821VQY9_9NEOP|nr:unnamed protein product [Pieris macdunnoughi]
MGFIVFSLKRILKLIVYFAFFVTLVLIVPNLPPYTKFSSIQSVPTRERTGELTLNSALNNAERLYEHKIVGPENFQIWNGELYTSLGTGEIVKCSPGGHVTFVTKIGKPCTGLSQEHICGRPLGFSIDEKNGLMYVADAYYGIWKVDLKTDKKQVLVSADKPIEGKIPRVFNSLVVDKKGGIYFTDSSSDFFLNDGVFSSLSDPSGRLFYFNSESKKTKVLVDNIWFANGVVLSPDESFVVVSETFNYRLLKHYISGPKKGKTEVFVDGLPGTPDNLRALPDGSGVQIAMFAVSDIDTPIITRSLSSTPHLRKFISRIAHLIELPFSYLNQKFPHPILEEIVYYIGSFASVSGLTDISGLIITDWNGNIVASFYNTDKSVAHISDAIVYNDKLVLGSPHSQDFIGAVDIPLFLKQAYKGRRPEEQMSTKQAKPSVKETPKPAEKATSQKSQTQPPTRKPELKQTQPETKSTTQNPETKPTTQKPGTRTPPQKLETKPTTQKPETKPTTQKPETKPTTQKPETKPSTQNPEIKPTTQKPETKPTTQKPETKPTTQKPETKPTTQKPETKPSTQNPEIKPTTQKPETKPTTQKPETKPTGKAAASSPGKENKGEPSKAQIKLPENKVSEATPSENIKGKPKLSKENKKEAKNVAPNHIPIEEEIMSDTVKPSKDRLKVIKKSGPEEIPNPH